LNEFFGYFFFEDLNNPTNFFFNLNSLHRNCVRKFSPVKSEKVIRFLFYNKKNILKMFRVRRLLTIKKFIALKSMIRSKNFTWIWGSFHKFWENSLEKKDYKSTFFPFHFTHILERKAAMKSFLKMKNKCYFSMVLCCVES
jgi:hypothetical protein